MCRHLELNLSRRLPTQVNSETLEVVGELPAAAAQAIEVRVTGSTQMRSVVEFAIGQLQVRATSDQAQSPCGRRVNAAFSF